MSVLQRGVLIVAGATFVASALILYNGKTIADSESGSRTVTTSADAKVTPNSVLNESVIFQKIPFKANSKAFLSPPPVGPFWVASPREMIQSVRLKKDSLLKSLSVPQEAMFKKLQPSFPFAPNLEIKLPVAPTQAKINLKPPVFSILKPQQPQQITAPRPHPIMPFKNRKNPVNTHQKPQPPNQHNQKPFVSNPPVQRYMYVPVPMYRSQLRPQISVPKLHQVEPNTLVKGVGNHKNDEPLEAIKFKKDKVTK
ncbi:MAG: hypothetical protein V3V19_00885 [Cocleimonas sp.]